MSEMSSPAHQRMTKLGLNCNALIGPNHFLAPGEKAPAPIFHLQTGLRREMESELGKVFDKPKIISKFFSARKKAEKFKIKNKKVGGA